MPIAQGLDKIAQQWHDNVTNWSSSTDQSSSRRRRRPPSDDYDLGDNDNDDGMSAINGVDIVTSTRRMRDIKRVMKEIWEVRAF